MLTAIILSLYIIIAYITGSVCAAIIVCRIFGFPDPRTDGSKNPGATNVLRIAGKKYAIIVLIVDFLKGLLPVLIASLLGASSFILGCMAFACVIGHMYPIFFNFKGGKGVATVLGALLGINWVLGGLVILTWLVVASLSRYSSLASMTAILLAPFYSWIILKNPGAFIPLALIAMLILYKHKSNLKRLITGQEPTIKFKSA